MKKSGIPGLKIKLFLIAIVLIGIIPVSAQDLNPALWPHLKGYWKYQNVNNLTKATVGKDLTLVGTHQSVTGPSVGDTAIRIGIGSYYVCRHNMAPNGGGDSVNRYTLMIDFKVLSFKKWHTFFKTDSNNNNDGECFIRPLSGTNPGRIGVAATGYSKDSINPNQWYRLMISVNLNNYYRYYINGKLFHEGDTQEVDGRFALTPKMIFFGDDNQEDDTIDVASVAVFDTCLSALDIAKIGSIDPCVANPPKLSLGKDTSLCEYNTLVKNAGAGFKKYQWFNGSTQQSITLTKNVGIGKKNIWCKVTDVNGCVVADTFVLTLNAAPVVSLGADQAFCQGLKTKLIAGSDTTLQYLWKYLPKGNTLSIKNSITTDSSGKYMVTVTNVFGCFNRDTVLLTVYPRPAKPVITLNGNTSFCQGGSVILSGPNGFFNYQWSNGIQQQNLLVYKNDTLKLKVTDNNNCVSFYSDSIVVHVFPLPLKPVIQLIGNDTFCKGDSAILIAPSGYSQYLWRGGGNLVGKVVKLAGWYDLSVRDAKGCVSPKSDSIRISLYPLPATPVIQLKGKANLCQGEYAQLSGPSGLAKYFWSDNRHTQMDTVTVSGNYTLSVANNVGCRSSVSNTISISVHSIPARPSVIKIAGDSLQCSTVDSLYSWFRNSALLSATGQIIKTNSSGFYQVQTNNKWCSSLLSDSFLHTNVNVQKLSTGDLLLKLSPHPFTNDLNLQLNNDQAGQPIRISIYDITGRQVYELQVLSEQLKTGLQLQLSELISGNYVLKIQGAQLQQTAKLIKF